jgi:hypothetical protein
MNGNGEGRLRMNGHGNVLKPKDQLYLFKSKIKQKCAGPLRA